MKLQITKCVLPFERKKTGPELETAAEQIVVAVVGPPYCSQANKD